MNLKKYMRYLGNKGVIVDQIIEEIKTRVSDKAKVLDCFGGTGCVTKALCENFDSVDVCDVNYYAYVLCYSRCLKRDDVHIDDHVVHLNSMDPITGMITKLYSPHGNRKYFTTENAMKIDAIRTELNSMHMKNMVTDDEHILLLGNLIESVSRYSNIPGTYGAFNETWDPRSLKPFTLKSHIELQNNTRGVAYHTDARTRLDTEYDVIYMDPPYNQRNYASYYHVLESIAKYDDTIKIKDNKTGTPVSVQSSAWCSKTKCLNELKYFLSTCKAKVIVMSYNNEGIIPEDDLLDAYRKVGTYTCIEIDHKRFTCNGKGASKVVEKIHVCVRVDTWKNTIFNECCIEGMNKRLPDNSVDMICTDLPYGVTECKWDTVINLDDMWREYKRILKPYGTVVLFGQQPFTSRLVSSNYDMFKYSLVWKKSKPGGFAQAPYKVLCEHEDILVFSEGKTSKNAKNKMTYNPQGTTSCNKTMKGKTGDTDHRKGRKTQSDYVQTVTNYPRSILEFKNEGKCIHPTQKPIQLIEYLIKTFSNEGDVIMDSCMGSATTAIACKNIGRVYVGFEKDTNIFEKSNERLHLS